LISRINARPGNFGQVTFAGLLTEQCVAVVLARNGKIRLNVAGLVRFLSPSCLQVSIFEIPEKDMIRKRNLYPQIDPSGYEKAVFLTLKF
jgi:hypothetical protein